MLFLNILLIKSIIEVSLIFKHFQEKLSKNLKKDKKIELTNIYFHSMNNKI